MLLCLSSCSPSPILSFSMQLKAFSIWKISVVSKLQSGCRGVLVPLYGGVYLKVWSLNLPHCRWLWKTILMSSTSARWSLSTCSSWRTAKWVRACCAHMLTLKNSSPVLIELRLNKRVDWWDVARLEHTIGTDWPIPYDNLLSFPQQSVRCSWPHGRTFQTRMSCSTRSKNAT